MRTLKKLTAVLLAVMLTLTMCVTGLSVAAAEDTYWLAGSEGVTDPVWGGALEVPEYQLSANEDGTYSIVLANVAVGKGYQFKIVKNSTEWIGDSTGNNFTFDVTSACDVTITYKPATGEVTYTGSGVANSVFQLDALYAVGNGDGAWLNDAAWNPAAAANKMTEVKPGVYELVMEDVEAYDNYQIKFAANGTWADSWGIADQGDGLGSGELCALGTAFDAQYNGENIILPFAADDTNVYTIKCVVDLSAYDAATKTGGTIKITATPAGEPIPTDPVPTDPVPTDPVPTDPVPTDPVVGDTYWLAGSEGVTDPVWGGALEVPEYQLSANEDGTYSIVLANVAVGKGYQFKIVKNSTEWIGDSTGNNFTFDVTSACDVTITYKPATGEVTYTGSGVANSVFQLDALYAVGNGDGAWLNDAAWNPAAAANKMTEVNPGVYELTMTGVEAYDNYQIKFAANGAWTDSWGIADQGDGLGSGELCTLGTAFDAQYNGENIILPFAADDTNTYTIKCVVDLSAYDAATKTGGTITITATAEAPAGTVLKFAAPTSTTNRYNWTTPTFFYGNSTTMSSNTSIEMTATTQKYFTTDTGSNTLISGGNGWTVYEVVLDEATAAAVDAAKFVGFASGSTNRTTLTSTGNILKAGVDEFGKYASANASVASLADKTFVIRDSEWGATSAISYTGCWLTKYNTIKFAAPVALTKNSNWDAVEFYYANGGSFDNATKLAMVNTLDTTKITDLGNMTNLRVGNWYIYAVSVDTATAAAINASTNAGFAKPGASNKTAFSKNVLKALTNEYTGTYAATARTLDELEGQVFVVEGRATATSLLSFNGEWQTEDVYTQGNDDTITIKFAAPKGTKASNDWDTGVELYYGDTTAYRDTQRIAMTATNETLAVDVSGTSLTSLVSGDWVIYSVELTLDQVKAIDNAKSVGFIKAGSYNRTTTNFYRSITRASKIDGVTSYSGISESIETYGGLTFVINGMYNPTYETTTYTGSWVG